MKTKITAVALAALMVLTIFASVIPASAAEVTSLEVRGTVEDTGAIGAVSWTSNNWAVFNYDINDPAATNEKLAYIDDGLAVPINPLGGVVTDNVINAGELKYTTSPSIVPFEVVSSTTTTNADVTLGYNVMGWMAEKYVAVAGDPAKITKLVLEQDSDDKMTLRTGESWDLGAGYTLTPEQIDVDGNKVWLTLSKDGVQIEDVIVDTKSTSTAVGAVDTAKTFAATADFAGKTKEVYFVTYVDSAFRGTATDLVQLKYTWLIDKSDITTIKSDDTFGNFEVKTTTGLITLANEEDITLTADDKISFMGDMYFVTSKAAKGTLGGYLFYPAKEVTIGGEVPAVEEPAVEEPAVEEPAVEEPAVEEPAVGEPAVEEPAVGEPAVEEPEVEVEPPEEEPGFEAIFAIAGLLAVAYLVRRD